ncbi:MAG: hypothetical protein ACREBS_09350, partial [Nitrososphaerales archaeon]
GNINPERLCPTCLKNSRFDGVCQSCGLDLSERVRTFQTFYSGTRHHEIMDKLQQSLEPRTPIPLRIQTIAFLKGNKKERIAYYCKSRLEQLFKKYAPDHSVTNRAASIVNKETDDYFTKNDLTRIGREDKLALVTKVLLKCKWEMPHLTRMWDDMISGLLSTPQVFLYDERR